MHELLDFHSSQLTCLQIDIKWLLSKSKRHSTLPMLESTYLYTYVVKRLNILTLFTFLSTLKFYYYHNFRLSFN